MKLFQNWSKETFQKVFITVIFTSSALYGTMYYYVLKQVGLLKEARSEVTLTEHLIAEAEKMAEEAQRDQPNREQVMTFVETHRGGMITGDPFAWVVREISLLGENRPVQILGLHPGAKDNVSLKNRYATFSLRIDLAGRYDEIATFIRDLENRFATGRVKALEFSGSPSGQHQARLDLVLLVVPEPKSIGPAKKTG
jgi:hypothetical protein